MLGPKNRAEIFKRPELSILVWFPWLDTISSINMSCCDNFYRAVEVLLEHNAPLAATDSEGHTPLFLALRQSHSKAAGLLIKAGSPLDTISHVSTPTEPFMHTHTHIHAYIHTKKLHHGSTNRTNKYDCMLPMSSSCSPCKTYYPPRWLAKMISIFLAGSNVLPSIGSPCITMIMVMLLLVCYWQLYQPHSLYKPQRCVDVGKCILS